MSLRPMTMVLGLAGIAVSFVFADYDRAESNLKTFYAQMANADFDAATHNIDEAIRLWPSNARYHSWRGYVLSQSLPSQCATLNWRIGGKVAQTAAGEYRRALQLNGRDAVAHHNLGWLNHLMGQDMEARREWEQALALDPDTAI